MKYLKRPIFYLQWILIIFSLIAFILIHIESFQLNWNISSVGFQNYLGLYDPYSILFSAAFIVLASNLAIERMGLMYEANLNSYKANNRTIWIQTLREFFPDIKDEDPYMIKIFVKKILLIYDFLHEINFTFNSKKTVEEFIEKLFDNDIEFFEQMNVSYRGIGVYRDEHHSYSFASFQYLIFIAVNVEMCYKDFRNDLFSSYMIKVRNFQSKGHLIDVVAYENSLKEHKTSNRNLLA